MAKKKKVKSEESESFQYSAELIGLILILIGLIGFGFGVVGAFIKKFAMFLVGEWWPIILIFIIFIGSTMIIGRKKPKYFSQRYVGFYLLFLVILILSHYTFIKSNMTLNAVLSATKENYMARIATISGTGPILSSGQVSISVGGGFIGAIFAGLFVQLFSLVGTIIVVVAMGIVGTILLFNLNFGEILKSIKEFFSKDKLVTEEDENDDEDDEEDTEDLAQENDNKVVITSVEELKNHPAIPAQSAPAPQVSETQTSNNLPYTLPPITLLDLPKKDGKVNSNDFIRSNKTILERVLKEFGIIGQVVEIHIGPAVTQYEMHIQAGTKVSRIVSLNKEIALALAAKDVRIEAPIPGKNTIGIEIPNQVISPVKIREVLGNIPDSQKHAHILVSLGKDIMGRVQTADISKMPHLLVAGATGSQVNQFVLILLLLAF
jgi:S-DNA-T family DNA segregation ATPase FtsK/SpoIIIE